MASVNLRSIILFRAVCCELRVPAWKPGVPGSSQAWHQQEPDHSLHFWLVFILTSITANSRRGKTKTKTLQFSTPPPSSQKSRSYYTLLVHKWRSCLYGTLYPYVRSITAYKTPLWAENIFCLKCHFSTCLEVAGQIADKYYSWRKVSFFPVHKQSIIKIRQHCFNTVGTELTYSSWPNTIGTRNQGC